jgi:hypothetical protein
MFIRKIIVYVNVEQLELREKMYKINQLFSAHEHSEIKYEVWGFHDEGSGVNLLGFYRCIPTALSLGVEQPGREADHSHPSSAKVKECVVLYLHSPIRLHGVVLS